MLKLATKICGKCIKKMLLTKSSLPEIITVVVVYKIQSCWLEIFIITFGTEILNKEVMQKTLLSGSRPSAVSLEKF